MCVEILFMSHFPCMFNKCKSILKTDLMSSLMSKKKDKSQIRM